MNNIGNFLEPGIDEEVATMGNTVILNDTEYNLEDFEWVKFPETYTSRNIPFVSVFPDNNKFYLNSQCIREIFEKSDLEQIKATEVGIDYGEGILVFKLLDRHTPNSISLSTREPNDTSRVFANTKLMDKLGNSVERGRYKVHFAPEKNILLVDLSHQLD